MKRQGWRSWIRARFHIIGNAHILTLCKYQSCMFSKLPIICKQTVLGRRGWRTLACPGCHCHRYRRPTVAEDNTTHTNSHTTPRPHGCCCMSQKIHEYDVPGTVVALIWPHHGCAWLYSVPTTTQSPRKLHLPTPDAQREEHAREPAAIQYAQERALVRPLLLLATIPQQPHEMDALCRSGIGEHDLLPQVAAAPEQACEHARERKLPTFSATEWRGVTHLHVFFFEPSPVPVHAKLLR